MSEFSGPIATASVIIVPDTTKFRALLEAELVAATAAATKGLAASSTGAAGALKAEAAAAQASGAALAKDAVATETDAAAKRVNTKATREAALAHEQFARGAGASLLTLGGLRGATLAASAPFLIGTASVVTFAKAVKEASAEQEALARVQIILGPALGHVSEEWAKQQEQMGLSAASALKFEGALAEVFHNLGLTTPKVAELSQRFVELAPDMAAFANVPVEDILRALQLGISGNLRSLRPFIGALRQADVTQRALSDSGKEAASSLTSQELALARVALIQEAAANQIGTFAARSGDAAAQTKILKAELANLGTSLGSFIAPGLVAIERGLSDDIDLIRRFVGLVKSVVPPTQDAEHHTTTWGHALNFLKSVDVIHGFTSLNAKTHEVSASLDKATLSSHATAQGFRTLESPTAAAASEADNLTLSVEATREGFQTLGPQVSSAAAFLAALGPQFSGLVPQINAATFAAAAFVAEMAALGAASSASINAGNKLLSLEIQGASSAKRIGAIQQDIAAQSSILATLGGPRGRRGRAALAQKASDVAQINAINAADAAAAKKGAGAADKAAREAQRLLDEADQRLLTEQGIAQTDIEIGKARAGQTKSLVDDVAIDRRQLRLLDQQIKGAQQIHDAVLRRQTIQQLTLTRLQTEADIAGLETQRRQNRRDRLVNAAEARVTSAELDASFAETQGHPRDRISALKRENTALEAEKKFWVGNTVKLKEIRNRIAENNATIKDIRGQIDDRGKAFRELAFSFLQTQQGFAANLLSNLLPTGAARGTVGGASPAAPTGPGIDLAAASAVSAGVAGMTRGQAAMLIDLNRGILGAVVSLVGTQRHPEARNQKVAASTDMAYGV